MKRISTPYMFSFKLLPFLFFGFVGFFLFLILINRVYKTAPIFLLVPCVMLVFGYQWWKTSVRDLADEVDDCGDYLLIKKRGEEDTVLLSNISNVNFTTARDGANGRITLTLGSPGKFGTEISFAPPPHIYLGYPRKNEVAEDLLTRAHKARSGSGV